MKKVNPKVPATALGGAVSAIFCYYAGVPAELALPFSTVFGVICGYWTPDRDA